ncbi:MAG: carbohydrate ABC transporter permease [Candidatus Parvarchaeota archaeon]|nr:carbohydrate ABC transporter permease [Candidatus Jingweiarchaeum tengchongense]MCW1306156.1 carbohydrate ABC transporter permease [Candidatus Jingweiarchaeum tengchongense]
MTKKQRRTVQVVVKEVTLIIITIVMLLPILLSITMSFETPPEVFTYPPRIFPNTFYLGNYVNAFNSIKLGRLLINSLIMSVIIVVGKTVFGILAGYAFANFKFKGSAFLFALLFVTIFMPADMIMIVPLYKLMVNFHWLNTYWALTVPFTASATSVFLMRQYFLTIPKELEDAARIDGASSMRYLTRILIPLSKTMIGSVIVINFVYAWNFYLWPLVVINSNSMQTAQIGLQMLMITGATRNWGIITAGTIIVLAPVLILFFAVQNLFVQGIVTTGLKE